ncbi:cobyrinic acid a,c-diamide synthase [Methylophaga sp. 42_8_T64]|nr:cobyrinic acid a,c-diamide synthase [Methylophaga sp. 41_12_T18]OUR85799.1 cobyrinic acid a,c-diamide synthase [Methylophaga sp. 42_8_T64]
MKTNCSAVVIAAPASGQGKTTVTATLARYYCQQGKQVRVFKAGPDFLDPTILEVASGHPVYQLDLWMVGKPACQQLLAEAAQQADVILIEGVMGLFDGDPSTADLATTFGIPVLAVIDASAMAQTFAALAYGLQHFQSDLPFAGVFANRIGSERHYQMLIDALPDDVNCFGALPRQVESAIPSRHLGLVQANEIDDLDQRLDQYCSKLVIEPATVLPQVAIDSAVTDKIAAKLQGQTIAIARDAAFSFIYQANLALLQQLGAELVFFSPLTDSTLPAADSIYLPGGYPELHLSALADNQPMKSAIQQHFDANKPIVAECGGMLYLTNSITDKQGEHAEMVGILAGDVTMQPRLAALALQQVSLNNKSLRGHTYHHSTFANELTAIAQAENPNGNHTHEAVYQQQRLTASYIHFYFPSNPDAIVELFLP